MSTLTSELTVGEIAAQNPAALRVFEHFGIDYCCGGAVPFDEACAQRNLDPAAVRAEIAAAVPGPAGETDWQSAPLGALIDHIVATHHLYMKRELPRITALLDKLVARHGDRLAPLAEIFAGMTQEIEAHLMKEEMILFPLIRGLESGNGSDFHCGSVRNPIRVMFMEHDSAGDALARMRALTNNFAPPEDACATFRACYTALEEMERDLHRHIHLENNILFPKAIALE